MILEKREDAHNNRFGQMPSNWCMHSMPGIRIRMMMMVMVMMVMMVMMMMVMMTMMVMMAMTMIMARRGEDIWDLMMTVMLKENEKEG